MMTTTNTEILSLDDMWEAAHQALFAGQWAIARQHLDDLSYIYGNRAHEFLPALTKYVSAARLVREFPDYAEVLSARIDQWNSHVTRNAL